MEEVFLGQRTAMAGMRGGWSMVDQQESLGAQCPAASVWGRVGRAMA